ncbi:MAG: 16S rRNA (cytosine(1402)-N(4))-methyltransferase RsmH [Sphingomonadaceae bacterium]|nr:16S rRNA (cytosine(1402)-N(4))-methyltransferase RsmH [Sphingomonadaceae bacterium]
MRAPHLPVLLDEVIDALALQAGDTYVDGTFGAGGYTRAALAQGIAHAYGFDRDPTALAAAFQDDRLTLIEERFSQMDEALAARGVSTVDAIALDIGVSSMQLDRAERGFSFQSDGPLDMRMGNDGPTAADFLNSADEAEIADVLYRYGEEPKSRRIARAIVAGRPLERTGQLADIVRRAVGYHPGAKDPATRAFQAIRIHVNGELDELDAGLRAAERLLKPGGRLAVVSFHSLEDRAVKRFLRERSGSNPRESRYLPEARGRGPAPTFQTPAKAVRASDAELSANPRARSATLRSGIRTDAPAWQ